MGETKPPQDWYFRDAEGRLTEVARGVTDAAPMLRANAYIKAARGEALTDDEREAVAAAQGLSLAASVNGNLVGEIGLGFLFLQAPELLEEFDALVGKMAARIGLSEALVWGQAKDYAARAEANEMAALTGVAPDEDFAEAYDAGRDLARFNLPPERVAEIVAERAAGKAFSAAWAASPEGKAAAEAMAPDDGPEGWSTVPPANPGSVR